MSASPTAVVPPTFSLSVVEEQTLAFDMFPDLEPGDTVTNVSVVVTNVDTEAVVDLTNAFSLASPVITQTLSPTADGMAAGQTYRLRITYTASFTGNVFARDLLVLVSE